MQSGVDTCQHAYVRLFVLNEVHDPGFFVYNGACKKQFDMRFLGELRQIRGPLGI